MPTRASLPCRQPGCGALLDKSGYCDTHKRQVQRQWDDRRGNSTERGYDSKWQKARRAYLQKHPLCVTCMDNHRVTAATLVDHIIPHRGDKALFWDSDNWQSQCDGCHNRKRQRESMEARHG